jgi:hypothetical protein
MESIISNLVSRFEKGLGLAHEPVVAMRTG